MITYAATVCNINIKKGSLLLAMDKKTKKIEHEKGLEKAKVPSERLFLTERKRRILAVLVATLLFYRINPSVFIREDPTVCTRDLSVPFFVGFCIIGTHQKESAE